MFDKKKDLRVMKVKKLFAVCFLLVTLPCFGVDEQNPSLRTATNSFGMSVAVWNEQIGCGCDVFAQQYDAEGNPIGEELWVSEGLEWSNDDPMVGLSDLGSFIVAWTNDPGPGFFVRDVYARLYRQGNLDDIFRLSFTKENGLHAEIEAVVMTASGKFAICWSEYELMEVEPGYFSPSNIRLWAQQFAPDGQPLTNVHCFTDAPFEYMGKRLRISEISVTEQEITVVYRGNDRQLKTAILFWADTKPKVTLQYQQQENPGEMAILTISPVLTGKKYQVYYCDDLTSSCWLSLGEPIIAESDVLTVTDDGGVMSSPLRETKSRFYKVCLVP